MCITEWYHGLLKGLTLIIVKHEMCWILQQPRPNAGRHKHVPRLNPMFHRPRKHRIERDVDDLPMAKKDVTIRGVDSTGEGSIGLRTPLRHGLAANRLGLRLGLRSGIGGTCAAATVTAAVAATAAAAATAVVAASSIHNNIQHELLHIKLRVTCLAVALAKTHVHGGANHKTNQGFSNEAMRNSGVSSLGLLEKAFVGL